MAINEPSSLSAMFKEQYGEVSKLLPSIGKLQKEAKFIQSDKRNGLAYVFPIVTNYENSVSFASPDSGLFDLEPINGMSTKRVSVKGSNIVLRAGIDDETLARATDSKQAFIKATGLVVENLMASASNYLESLLLYGDSPRGLGTVTSYTSVSSTRVKLNFDPSTFAVGIWMGRINALIELYDTTGTTKQGGTGAYFKIVATDIVNSSLTVEADASYITDIKTYLDSNDCSVFWKNSVGECLSGVDKLITNTGSLYGVDASADPLWSGNVYNVSGTLTVSKIYAGIDQAINKGLDEDITVYVPVNTFSKLVVAESALRVYDSSYKSSEFVNGATKLKFHAQNGKIITIESHSMIKPSEAYAIPKGKLLRVGACEFKFDAGTDNEYFYPIPNKAGKEIKLFSNQGLVATAPNMFVKFTDIT